MIFSLKDITANQLHNIKSLLLLKPVPQLPVWENMARLMMQKNCIPEACFLVDILAQYYGKALGRKYSERIFGVQMSQKGRDICSGCSPNAHPALFALRDNNPPVQIGSSACFHSGDNVLLISPDSSQNRIIHAIDDCPTPEPAVSSHNRPIQWIALNELLIFSDGTNKLTFIDLSCIPSPDKEIPLNHAYLTFNSPIHRICGPLNDGTFFITLEPQLPVFSDICKLCRLDVQKIQNTMLENPGKPCDIREINAICADITLSNIEQTLFQDCMPVNHHFMTCGGGMQNREVRFITSDGAWTTKFIHESPVIRILSSERGPVSLDDSGQAFLWNEQTVVDDIHFPFDRIPAVFKDDMQNVQFTVDWMHQRLYMTITQPPQSTLSASLKASHSCCLTPEFADSDAFVKKLFHLKDMTVAMLADGSFHFWNIQHDCIDPRWQLPQICAENADWHAILNTRSPAIEEDPRVRMIKL